MALMADGAIPVVKVSGTVAVMVFLYVVVIFGSLHLLAISHPGNKYAQAWIALGF